MECILRLARESLKLAQPNQEEMRQEIDPNLEKSKSKPKLDAVFSCDALQQ